MEKANIFQQTSLYSLQIAIPQMGAKHPLELPARASLSCQIIGDLFLIVMVSDMNPEQPKVIKVSMAV